LIDDAPSGTTRDRLLAVLFERSDARSLNESTVSTRRTAWKLARRRFGTVLGVSVVCADGPKRASRTDPASLGRESIREPSMARPNAALRVLVCGIVGVASLPGAAWAGCEYDLPLDQPVHADTFAEIIFEPECGELSDALTKRLDADPTLLVVDPEDDPESAQSSRAEALEAVALMSLRDALLRGNRDDARRRIDALLATAEPGGITDELLTGDETDWVAVEGEPPAPVEDFERTPGIGVVDILDGSASKAPGPIPSVGPDWVLEFGACGNPAFSWYFLMSRYPTNADAWVAVGRPDLALNALLAQQWVSGLALGVLPPHLRETAERFLGPGTYVDEVERALAGIQISEGPDGRRATLPLFGESLPLPLGYKTWKQTEPTIFQSTADLADFLRPVLLERE
jgi:hypothetical protein